MSPIEDLPPDQRAVVQLLVGQGKSYGDIASLLKIDVESIRTRARAGLDSLGPDEAARRLPPTLRGDLADYLLGQQSVSERAATRRELAGSAAARAWARGVADQLAPLARDELPEIPAADAEEPGEPLPAVEAFDEQAPAPASPPPAAPPRRAQRAAAPRPDRAEGGERPSSRVGGAILLVALAVAVAVVIVILATSGGSSKKKSHTNTTSTSTTQTSTNQVTPLAQITLSAVNGGSAKGLAILVQQGQQAGFVVRTSGLPALSSEYFAVWLTASGGRAQYLGAVRPQDVKNNGFNEVAPVPTNLSSFSQMIVTREPITKTGAIPKSPGPTILSGSLTGR